MQGAVWDMDLGTVLAHLALVGVVAIAEHELHHHCVHRFCRSASRSRGLGMGRRGECSRRRGSVRSDLGVGVGASFRGQLSTVANLCSLYILETNTPFSSKSEINGSFCARTARPRESQKKE